MKVFWFTLLLSSLATVHTVADNGRKGAHKAKHKMEISKQSGKKADEASRVRRIIGHASWYTYCGGMFAASTIFKKGSLVRVTNCVNHKSVDVVINDYGPDRRRHPRRIIDLDEVAFRTLAPLASGIIRIAVEPLDS